VLAAFQSHFSKSSRDKSLPSMAAVQPHGSSGVFILVKHFFSSFFLLASASVAMPFVLGCHCCCLAIFVCGFLSCGFDFFRLLINRAGLSGDFMMRPSASHDSEPKKPVVADSRPKTIC